MPDDAAHDGPADPDQGGPSDPDRDGPGPAARRSRVLVQPPPVVMNARRIVAFGTSLWFVAVIVQLPFYDWLGTHGHRITLWTSVAGLVLGFLGYAIMARHRSVGRTI